MPVQVDLKIVLLGDNSVGKSSLSYRYANDRFIPVHMNNTTIGSAYFSKKVTVGGKRIQLGIWDTAGSERYEAMTKLYYRGSDAAIVCYDVTRFTTFAKVKYWINELRSVEEHCKIYICATKKDLLDYKNDTMDNLETVENYADGIQAKFYLTSSRTGENVAELFQDIATDCAPTMKNQNTERSSGELIRLSTEGKKSSCCYSGKS